MLKKLWNIAVKVRDLDAEVEFLEACGATDTVRDRVQGDDGPIEFAMLNMGDERILLFPEVIYQSSLPQAIPFGLTHAVFEVDDFEEVLRAYGSNGINPLWGPREVSASFGRRRIAFFKSPSGFIFEVEQPLQPVG
jgi:catechol 2,3-dioxygenase-like lactoylglutathione lyase family enzyme